MVVLFLELQIDGCSLDHCSSITFSACQQGLAFAVMEICAVDRTLVVYKRE